MGPDSDESFNRETLKGFQTFIDPTDPVSLFHEDCICNETVYPTLTNEERERERGREDNEKNANDNSFKTSQN